MMFRKLRIVIIGVFISSVTTFSAFSQEQCIKVDLQAVSISPVLFRLEAGKITQVEVVMHNNGPCAIPVGQATAQITINLDHMEISDNIGFTDECKEWNYITSTTSGNLKNLF